MELAELEWAMHIAQHTEDDPEFDMCNFGVLLEASADKIYLVPSKAISLHNSIINLDELWRYPDSPVFKSTNKQIYCVCRAEKFAVEVRKLSYPEASIIASVLDKQNLANIINNSDQKDEKLAKLLFNLFSSRLLVDIHAVD